MAVPRIAILDDDDGVRRALARWLSSVGYESITFDSAEPFFEWWQHGQHMPDAVLLDMCMPGMSGLEVIIRIRKVDELTPIVVLTGNAGIPESQSALRLGADDLLCKPASISELRAAIDGAITSRRRSREQSTPVNAQTIERLPPTPAPPRILEAFGELVGSYCHDISNALAASRAYIEVARLMDDKIADLDAAIAAHERAVQHVQSLHAFARTLYRNTADPLQTVDRARMRRMIREIHDHVGGKGRVWVDLGQLPEVTLPEVLLSALLYPPIQNAATTPNALRLTVKLSIDGVANSLELAIGDNGPGWPKEPEAILRDLWANASFTTKGHGRGNGLGNLHRLVSRLGGGMDISRRTRGGAIVAIRIPLAGVVHAQ
jgi:FixJ family two-component response regulator